MSDWYEAEQRVERARGLFEQRKWELALQELRAAIAINPYNSGWLFNIGLTLDEMGRYHEATQTYRAVLDIDPQDLAAMNHLGVDLCRLGQYAEAISTFERIESIDPTFEPSYCNRIIVYVELGDHEQAEQMFYLARLFKDDCPHCYFNIGASLADRRLFARAIHCWQRVLDMDPSHPGVHSRLASAHWGSGDLESARSQYLIALQQDPGNIGLILSLGQLLRQMGRHDESGEKFRRAAELAPDTAECHYWLGVWFIDARRPDQATASFQRALRLDPTLSGAHLRLAEICHAARDPEAMRMHLRGELLRRPDDPTVLTDLSSLLMEIGHYRAAVMCLRRVVHHQPANVRAIQNLGVGLCLLGRLKSGAMWYRRALRQRPGHPTLMYNLALSYLLARRYPRARAVVRRALRTSPGDRSLQNLSLRIRVSSMIHRLRRIVRRRDPVRKILHSWTHRHRGG